jgi:hypothetical protein
MTVRALGIEVSYEKCETKKGKQREAKQGKEMR